jgi:hypothetical protein
MLRLLQSFVFPPCCYYLQWEIKRYEVWVSYNYIAGMQVTSKLVKRLSAGVKGHRHRRTCGKHGHLMRIRYSLRKESRLKECKVIECSVNKRGSVRITKRSGPLA